VYPKRVDIDHYPLLIEGVDQSIMLVLDDFHGIEARLPTRPDPEAKLQLWQAVVTARHGYPENAWHVPGSGQHAAEEEPIKKV
jgi:hypothetical protein